MTRSFLLEPSHSQPLPPRPVQAYLWCCVQVCYLWYTGLRLWSERRAWLAYSSRLQGNGSSESRS